MPSASIKSDSGFLLFEVMVAISIIAIALTVALGVQSRSVSMANEAKFLTTSSLLAQQKIAEIEAMPMDDIRSDSGDFGEDHPDFSWDVMIDEISYESNGASITLIQVNLNIFWGEDADKQYFIRFYRFPGKIG